MNKQGCAVHTEHAPEPSLVIDLDHPTAPVRGNARKCDYLFLAEDSTPKRLLVVPVELKSIGLNPAVVESQLQAGASVAERIVAPRTPELRSYDPVRLRSTFSAVKHGTQLAYRANTRDVSEPFDPECGCTGATAQRSRRAGCGSRWRWGPRPSGR